MNSAVVAFPASRVVRTAREVKAAGRSRKRVAVGQRAAILQFPDDAQRHKERCFKYFRADQRWSGYDDSDIRDFSNIFADRFSEQELNERIRDSIRACRNEIAALEAV